VAALVSAPEKTEHVSLAQLRVLDQLIHATSRNDPNRPGLLFRRAETCFELATLYGARHADAEVAHWRQEGITSLREIVDRAAGGGGYARTDEVLFCLAYALQQSGELADARVRYERLITDFPRSRFRADAEIALGDAVFEAQDLRSAHAAYERVLALPRSRVTDYARYKLAWTQLNEGDAEAALTTIAVLCRANDDAKIVKEARKDLVRFYARARSPERARAFFDSVDASQTETDLDLLADAYRTSGRESDCLALARGGDCSTTAP
jgi:TolA-binding protein